ncbi:hypothetical protein TSOC_014846, partial [Tetrabaena socialis]
MQIVGAGDSPCQGFLGCFR